MKRILLVLSLLFVIHVHAEHCRPPKGEKLIIGCTYDCSFTYRARLQFTGLFHGYQLEFVDLSAQKDLTSSLAQVDAILVPGGADINPEYYLGDVSDELRNYVRENIHLAKLTEESAKRDPFEYEVLKKYSAEEVYSHLPLLGICRGMQMMSVAQGIPLYLDIKTELEIPNRINKLDRIRVAGEDSIMQDFYGSSSFLGLKLHHQGLRVPYFEANRAQYPLVRVTASSNNGMIAEAIEWTHRRALGVQYHPEKSFNRASFPVLSWFLQQACDYKVNFKDRQ